MQLRTYVLIDSMQPQYAAYTGKRAFGMIPVEGDAQIYIEISPAAEVYKVMDIALKTTDVKPGFLSMEREYGFLEICVIEVAPAAYIVLAANEAEKAAKITLNHYSSSGAYGRLMISGTESAVMQSRDAAVAAIEALEGRLPSK
jgi:ethanolamine utilization microcompartment shell protein EutL